MSPDEKATLNLTTALSSRRGESSPLAVESIKQVLNYVAPASRELLFTLLSGNSEYFFLLDQAGHVIWANSSVILDFPQIERGKPFSDLLSLGAKKAFSSIFEEEASDGVVQITDYELHHELPSGVKVVSYRIVGLGDGIIAMLGYDRSNELEVVSQMAVLVQELESEVAERIRLSQILEEQATTDGLTGLMNRRQFDIQLEDEWRRWERYENCFSLLMVDIDHFKDINDTYGHQMGDAVLRKMAETLKETIRDCDTAARYGGEEFAIIGLNNDEESGSLLAVRLLENIRKTPMPPPLKPITVSIGVASVKSHSPKNPAQLLRYADEALYEAKRGGRNRSEVFKGNS